MSRISLADKVLGRSFCLELDQILQQHNHKVHSITKIIPRDCSPKTRQERRSNLRRIFAELHQLGYRLMSPTSLKQKHVVALAGYWRQKRLAAKTVHGLLSNLREFCRWIGKREVVRDINSYFQEPELLVRSTVAKQDHSWEGHGIDVSELLEKATKLDRRFGIVLSLARFFGLRIKEAIEFRPWLSSALDDDYILVSHGTKGGKQRIVKISNDVQRQILADAKKVVGDNINARLRWPERTWRQAQAHFYYLMRCLGVTKKSMDVSPHGLRHAFLQEEYQAYSGVPAPIKHAALLPENKSKHDRALLAVSLEAGHYRPGVTAGYCGSFGHQLRSIPKA